MPVQPTERRRRANGEQSRARILDAAAEIAGERGYEGTSISSVSSRCGLPASSIYWHFTDKDDLIAAVIERSFDRWLTAWEMPPGDDDRARFATLAANVAKAMLGSPDVSRLGLMLSLERRPVEPRARAMYLEIRARAAREIASTIKGFAPQLDASEVRRLTSYALAGADGLFIANQIDGDALDLPAMFGLHAEMLYDTAMRLSREGQNT